jgi:hypothetical protein
MKLRCVMIALTFLAVFSSDSWGQSRQPPAQGNQSAQPPAADQRGTDQVPLTVKILPAQDAKEKADKEDHEHQEKARVDEKLAFETQRIADYTDRLALFTVFLFCVAVLQAGFFFWQLRYMRQGMRDAEMAAKAAQDSAEATKESVTLAKETAEQQLRAYVGAQSVGFQDHIGVFKIQIIIVIKNFGSTPAYGCQTDIRLSVRENPLTGTFISHSKVFLDNGGDTLMPGNTNVVVCEPNAADQLVALQIYNEALAEKKAFYVDGQIRYKDVFGNDHHTNIRKIGRGHRMVEKGGSPFINADEGNDSN